MTAVSNLAKTGRVGQVFLPNLPRISHVVFHFGSQMRQIRQSRVNNIRKSSTGLEPGA